MCGPNYGVAQRRCNMVVMDEADKLLCPEFQPIIEELFNPEERNTYNTCAKTCAIK